MPMVKTWSEELVAEYLSIMGYVVLTNFSFKTKSLRGRNEADIIGFRLNGENIEIIHVEVGKKHESTENTIENICKKFDEYRVEYIKEYILSILGKDANDPVQKRNISYRKIFIFMEMYDSELQAFLSKCNERLGDIEIINFTKLYFEKIIEIVEKHTKEGKHFPEGFWLFNLLWELSLHDLLKVQPKNNIRSSKSHLV